MAAGLRPRRWHDLRQTSVGRVASGVDIVGISDHGARWNRETVSNCGGRCAASERRHRRFTPVAGPVTQPDLAPAPSVDIANGSPSGADASDRIVMSYVSGPLAAADVFFTESTDPAPPGRRRGRSRGGGPRDLHRAGDLAQRHRRVHRLNAFATPFRPTTATPRTLIGVVLHADSSTNPAIPTGAFSELQRGAPGDPRASSANALTSEFLGDYVYATATRTYGAAVCNDTRNGTDCPAIDACRQALQDGDTSATAPDVQQQCPATFGNSDIFGGSYPDPTP